MRPTPGAPIWQNARSGLSRSAFVGKTGRGCGRSGHGASTSIKHNLCISIDKTVFVKYGTAAHGCAQSQRRNAPCPQSCLRHCQPTPADAPATPGIALTTPGAGQSALLPPAVLALLVSLHRARRAGAARRRLQARRSPPGRLRWRRAAGLPRRHRGHPRRRLARGADAGRAARPPRGDHRPDRPEDGHQRAELRRQGASWPTSRIRPRRPGPTC